MKQSGKCPKCGSTELIADAKAIDRGDLNSQHDMSVATFRRPQAFIFKDKQETTVSAWVCGSCGFIEYYADSPVRLKLTNSPTFTTVRTARTAIEAEMMLSALRAAGLHPCDISLSPHFSVAGAEISYAIDVPTHEAIAARDVLESL